MDVVLGVAVTGPVARLALVGPGADVIDQSVVDLADNPVGKLTETVVGTNRLLTDENHRLVGTRVCWSDDPRAGQLRQALEASGVSNVAVLSESQAVAALMRAAGRPGAALVMDDATATLSVPGSADDQDAPPTVLAQEPLAGGDATATFNTMMAQLSARPDAPGEVYLVGASPELAQVAEQFHEASTMRVQVADDPSFALARGAAMAAAAQTALSAGDATAMAPAVGLTGDETAMAPAAGPAGDETTFVPPPNAEEPQLAYSMTEDAEPLPEMDDYGDGYDDFDETTAIPSRLSRRSLLLGNAVIAFAVIGFASLAAAVAIAVRPTASQQPVVGHQNAAPGKFMPLLPTQQQAPVPPPPVDQPNAGFQGGVVPDANGLLPAQGGGGPAVPVAPVSPGTPGFVPNPNPAVPLPIPVIVPVPVYPPPPYNTPTITTTTPTITTTTTPTTTTPTTTTPTTTTPTTTTPSTTTPTTTTPTTTTPAQVTTTPPTSTKEPFTSTETPTTAAPPPITRETTVAPHTQTQQTLVPQQPHTRYGF
ncbi:hypothetical protein [Mycobacterium nebraskense]|uniref:DUF7159 domain-containing protein n=1 Tax=Mycobacterium nebraskense TaxID=244292 RepID=A0A0F5N403_9MYCO|nr:hypothetical protein [Mycobacterium nebraskense]KKC01625.1 hypothetical protein WU83_28465 [Mycobacterium nebraskense]KLO41183.1 hypothetical protein ABW17_14650 [Mycobacterium nebraskense]MBI2694115.1 hypothetical protein [Mycobacterium nebraskense]MCV7119145.1 hypothetical protein [Mycobacterium nebraskense]ORW15334.1 hypothetical protein AWC17_18075 [Mycobacterium nebraskense]